MKVVPDTIALVVADRRRSARWYVSKLGFRELAKDDGHWTVVGAGDGSIAFHLCEFRGAKGPTRADQDTGIRLKVRPPLMTAYRALRKKGVRFPLPPQETPFGWHSKISDPDGNQLWLVAHS